MNRQYAHDFAVTNRSQQATMLQQWATEPMLADYPYWVSTET